MNLDIPYQPKDPVSYRPRIGLIGCGGISKHHLIAYRKANYDVAALCDVRKDAAEMRRLEYYPDADTYDDYNEVLKRDDIEVVDITVHPPSRPPIIEAALLARKHVLSQKPYVLDLDVGERLADLADKMGVYLAVNQNGRWAPHFSYMRQAIVEGVLGETMAAHMAVHWDHSWVKDYEFAKVKHLILYDYAVHWFDILRAFLPGKKAKRVYASTARSPRQEIMPALLAQALIEFDEAQATLTFDADTTAGKLDHTFIVGTNAIARSDGPSEKVQTVTISTPEGSWSPTLLGSWFSDGFHGTMAEMLCAIEEKRPSTINARDNLESLALCFAAVQSGEIHEPVIPGTVRTLPA